MWPLASDEGPHPADGQPGWEESWDFDFVCFDRSLGGAVRLGLRGGEAWYWAHMVGPGRDLVAVRDHELGAPRGRALEVRGSGLWAELTCETPLDHWSAGLEALGVAFDHPAEAYGSERGQPVAVGLDLEWEAVGPCRATPGTGRGWHRGGGTGYEQPCAVHGDVLIGDERIPVDASGWRTHTWGVRDWWDEQGPERPGRAEGTGPERPGRAEGTGPERPGRAGQWWRAHGQLEDGTTLSAQGTGDGHGIGVVVGTGDAAEPAAGEARLETHGPRDLPGRAKLAIGEAEFDVAPLVHAPVLIPGPARQARLWRAMCRFSDAAGREGAGWCERAELTRAGAA